MSLACPYILVWDCVFIAAIPHLTFPWLIGGYKTPLAQLAVVKEVVETQSTSSCDSQDVSPHAGCSRVAGVHDHDVLVSERKEGSGTSRLQPQSRSSGLPKVLLCPWTSSPLLWEEQEGSGPRNQPGARHSYQAAWLTTLSIVIQQLV